MSSAYIKRYQLEIIQTLTAWKFNSWPLKRDHPKRKPDRLPTIIFPGGSGYVKLPGVQTVIATLRHPVVFGQRCPNVKPLGSTFCTYHYGLDLQPLNFSHQLHIFCTNKKQSLDSKLDYFLMHLSIHSTKLPKKT